MKRKTCVVLILICILSLIRVLFTVSLRLTSFEVYKNEYGIITKIRKDSNKTVLDIKAKKKYRITLYKNLNYGLGDKVHVKGIFKTADNNTVFNLFNYRKYLLSKNVKLIGDNVSVSLVSKNNNFLYKIKNKIIYHIDKYKSKNYLRLFILGDNSYMEDGIIKTYRNIGISHLFSISGMHVNFFVVILNFLLKKVKRKDAIIVLFLLFLLFLTNYTESLLRCTFFIILSDINKLFKLKIKSIYLLVITAFILLFINPYLIYSVGFLFSTIITFFIILSRNLMKKKGYIKKSIIMSSICFLASIPIISSSFFKVNLLTPVFNVIFIPIVSLIIFPFGILTFILPFLDNAYFMLTSFLEKLANFTFNINMFTFALSKTNMAIIFLYYLFLYLMIKKNKKYILLYLVLLFININSRFLIIKPFVTFLDVGQGDSNIIVMPGGKTILIDTAGSYNISGKIVNNRLIPYLNSIGINKIDYLILTHGDYDHMGEAINLVNNFKVEKVIFNCGEYNDLEKELIKVLDKKKIKYYSCIKELNIDKNKLYFLNNKDYGNENDNSSVIYTELNNYKFLFMGDAGIEVEEDIIEKYNLSDIDVLKVGHHGSKTSSSKEFINEVNPKYSIISVGKNNRYGHPNDSVLDNLENSKIYMTDKDGSIMFKINNNKLQTETCPP